MIFEYHVHFHVTLKAGLGYKNYFKLQIINKDLP
jgi:hypothetical protein